MSEEIQFERMFKDKDAEWEDVSTEEVMRIFEDSFKDPQLTIDEMIKYGINASTDFSLYRIKEWKKDE
jgi:hypothetical protein